MSVLAEVAIEDQIEAEKQGSRGDLRRDRSQRIKSHNKKNDQEELGENSAIIASLSQFYLIVSETKDFLSR